MREDSPSSASVHHADLSSSFFNDNEDEVAYCISILLVHLSLLDLKVARGGDQDFQKRHPAFLVLLVLVYFWIEMQPKLPFGEEKVRLIMVHVARAWLLLLSGMYVNSWFVRVETCPQNVRSALMITDGGICTSTICCRHYTE